MTKKIFMGLLMTTIFLGGCGRNTNSENNNTASVPTVPANTAETQDSNSTDVSIDHTMDNTNESTTTNSIMITELDAKQIALKKVPGATENDIKKFHKDTDDAIEKYEGEIHYDGKEYEFEIHAYDGSILEWDVEPLEEITH